MRDRWPLGTFPSIHRSAPTAIAAVVAASTHIRSASAHPLGGIHREYGPSIASLTLPSAPNRRPSPF